jgi:hypothetical protein
MPETGLIIIESTGEGKGDFYDRVQIALKAQQEQRVLSPKDFLLHFYPWYIEPAYSVNPNLVSITADVARYLNEKEIECGVTFTQGQRAWYAVTLASTFNGAIELMYSQFPTTADEPFYVSSAGNYFLREMQAVRATGRICNIPVTDVPVNLFLDIGNADGTAVWAHQKVGMENRFIKYYENHGEKLSVYVKEILSWGFIINTIYLPHDAGHKRLSDTNDSIKEMLEKLMPTHHFELVPKISDLNTGIQITKAQFSSMYFDRAGTAEGVARLDGYCKRRAVDGSYHDDPDKSNGCSEAADALRQFAQAEAAGNVVMRGNTGSQDSGYYREAPDWRL